MKEDGQRWYAPTNWISVPSYDWSKIERVEPISTAPNSSSSDCAVFWDGTTIPQPPFREDQTKEAAIYLLTTGKQPTWVPKESSFVAVVAQDMSKGAYAGIKDGTLQWVFVSRDGVPFSPDHYRTGEDIKKGAKCYLRTIRWTATLGGCSKRFPQSSPTPASSTT